MVIHLWLDIGEWFLIKSKLGALWSGHPAFIMLKIQFWWNADFEPPLGSGTTLSSIAGPHFRSGGLTISTAVMSWALLNLVIACVLFKIVFQLFHCIHYLLKPFICTYNIKIKHDIMNYPQRRLLSSKWTLLLIFWNPLAYTVSLSEKKNPQNIPLPWMSYIQFFVNMEHN